MVVLMAVACVIGFGALRAGQSAASAPGITLREAFSQPPGAPPPGRPPVETPAQSPPTHPAQPIPPADGATPPALPPDEVVVHVAGAVRHPGVYHLPPGARNDDALKAAGGPTADANTDAVNLAAHAEDGSQLFIPTRKEHPDGGAPADPAPSETSVAVPNSPAAPVRGKAKGGATGNDKASKKQGTGRGHSNKLTSPSEGQINLNTADEEQLERLPGVGPAMAARLIAYRQQNGGFHKLEDLLQVSGIGQKKFAKLQPFVKLH
jgi:competence protein ComEA